MCSSDLAENALAEGHRLRLLRVRRELHLSYSRLGALRLAQGRLTEAARFTDAAISTPALSNSELLAGTLLQQRGLIRLAQGKTSLALADLERAEMSAERWRAAAPPLSQSALTAADAELDRSVGRAFIETAAHEALQPGGDYWARFRSPPPSVTAPRACGKLPNWQRCGVRNYPRRTGPLWRSFACRRQNVSGTRSLLQRSTACTGSYPRWKLRQA